jgi:uracil-DNA glycosylase family 4
MEPYGNFKKGIMNIGEAPGEMEDESGKPFQGKTGQLLQKVYRDLGVDLFEDCVNINAVLCRPTDRNGNNRAPENYEIECCRQTVLRWIGEWKPKVIILLGNSAVYSLIGHRWKRDLGGITKWRGWQIPDQDLGTWVCPTFYPSYVERAEGKDVMTIWKEDLREAFRLLEESEYQGSKIMLHPFPKWKEPKIDFIEDLSPLYDIKGEVAVDYETTGIKPHAPGHRIICCGVADSADHAYVFPLPASRVDRQPLTDLLHNQNIGKIAQNMKYEHAWSLVKLRVEVRNWIWDTMIMAHILDNRPGVTSLKFQAYVQFGIVDYASAITPYLRSKDSSNGNSINRIFELLSKPGGMQMLLKYVGYDAIMEYRLAKQQQAELLPF